MTERDTLLLIKRALEQAQDCILGEAPPDITRKRAREDTLNKIRKALGALESQPVTWKWGDRLSDLPETGTSTHPSSDRLSPHNEFNPQREYPGTYGQSTFQACTCQPRPMQLAHEPGCPLSSTLRETPEG